jgi:tetraacyldisaccharide 4'-kinase
MFRFLFFPISAIYGLCVFFRRRVLYGCGIIKRTPFDIPVICVGNLAMGGTGKTPHTEYLVRWLKENYRVATLSRGYKRETSGFICAQDQHGVSDIGDEPMQYYSEFGDKVIVAVDENRVHGVSQLLRDNSDLQAVVLDDAFQHLPIKAGYNILLTDYFTPYFKDYIVPMGSLREQRSAAKFADMIVVTKCPKVLSPITRDYFLSKIKPSSRQKVLFSYFTYGDFVPVTVAAEQQKQTDFSQILLLTGIVNPYPLKEYLMEFFVEIHSLAFPDHHAFSSQDVDKIKNEFEEIITSKKAIITTQKDAMRLLDSQIKSLVDDLPIYYVPLTVKFHTPYDELFAKEISAFINSF